MHEGYTLGGNLRLNYDIEQFVLSNKLSHHINEALKGCFWNQILVYFAPT